MSEKNEQRWSVAITDEKGTTVHIKRERRRLLQRISELLAYIEDTPDADILQDMIRGRGKSTSKSS